MQRETKMVNCSYEFCYSAHHDFGNGPPQELQVPVDYLGPKYCSITCYCLGTNTKVTDYGSMGKWNTTV